MNFRLWTLNRALRWIGLTVSVSNPGLPEDPTVISFEWIGWGAKAKAADDMRGPASGYQRDEDRELRYMRCIAARDDAWDAAVAKEYGT